jgi:SAM-dependent MidA family methyltransferase
LTVAAFMDLALYHPEFGYYARAAQRSGRAGDFFTSVDVGPLFGELLEVQLAEMASLLRSTAETAAHAETFVQRDSASSAVALFDLVEAGAGNGRLSADILRAARAHDRAFYDSIRLHLVEASAEARAAQAAALGDVAERLASSGPSLPASFDGVLIANELLDALPVHQVVMRKEGLREVYVVDAGAPERSALRLVEDAPSTAALGGYLARLGVELQPGWRVEINLRAIEWIRDAARRLRRGFIILIDYGHEARELYSPSHSAGTLTTFRGHRGVGSESSAPAAAWLQAPGDQDITAHVDFTSVRAAAEGEGLQTLGFLDQTYFLLGLVADNWRTNADAWSATADGRSARALAERRMGALKTLVMPGGLGSTHKVMIFGKGVGTPALRGCSYRMRVT